MKVEINANFCKGCLYCVKFCPCGVLEKGSERSAKGFFVPVAAHPDKCTLCSVCAGICPDAAIELR